MVDLNLDAGESPDETDALYALAQRVNVACGGHAGDAATVAEACARAAATGAGLGAHPGYPDRAGFGRRPMALSPAALDETLRAQCRLLAEAAARVSWPVVHVKLHGALYHAAHEDPLVAHCALEACRAILGPVAVLGMPRGALGDVARSLGMPYVREGFADRGYGPDGRLLPRGTPGSVLDAEAAAVQCRALVSGGSVDTVCVHGDGAEALAMARVVRRVLDAVPR